MGQGPNKVSGEIRRRNLFVRSIGVFLWNLHLCNRRGSNTYCRKMERPEKPQKFYGKPEKRIGQKLENTTFESLKKWKNLEQPVESRKLILKHAENRKRP